MTGNSVAFRLFLTNIQLGCGTYICDLHRVIFIALNNISYDMKTTHHKTSISFQQKALKCWFSGTDFQIHRHFHLLSILAVIIFKQDSA